MNKPVICSTLLLLAAHAACQAQTGIGIKVSDGRLVSSIDGCLLYTSSTMVQSWLHRGQIVVFGGWPAHSF